jgi:hypothetical protein
MSKINGDKAKFHRRRKHKIARRIQQKELFKKLAEATTSSSSKAKTA